MAKRKRKKRYWEGGYIIRDSNGRDVFYIRKQIDGTRYDLSTRCHSHRAAVEQLQRFEANPEAYNAAGTAPAEPIHIDEKLAREFLLWCRDVRKNSVDWLARQKRYLAWWAGKLKKVDLRRASLVDHIKPPLKAAANRNHRIAVLKAFYGWLRKEKHLLSVDEDPTFQALVVPQTKPEQWKRVKSIPKEHYTLARGHIAPHWRDGMDLQAGTGWHVSEVMRFAKNGSAEPYPKNDRGIAGVVVCPQTKGGEMLRTAVSAEVLEAAERILKRGSFGREKYGLAVKAACRAAKIPPFTPGRFRHSVATWAINEGADPATVAAFLNHKSPRTTMRFYATHAVPKKVPTLL
ncbi:MAG: site-specific integrase [Myxococcaceae bacterium]|nr:site-specific integrase [Myxococcaceae bacterium]